MKISQAQTYQKLGVLILFYLHFSQSSLYQLLTNGHISCICKLRRNVVAVRPSRPCRKGLTTMQRGRRCTPTGAPLQTNEGLTARKRQLFQTKTAIKNSRKSWLQKSRKGLTALQPPLFMSQNRRETVITSPKMTSKQAKTEENPNIIL